MLIPEKRITKIKNERFDSILMILSNKGNQIIAIKIQGTSEKIERIMR